MPKSWTNSCNGPEGACKTSATPNPANASDGVDGSREYVFSSFRTRMAHGILIEVGQALISYQDCRMVF